MNARDFETALQREVDAYPGVSIHFGQGGKHRSATVSYNGDSRKIFYPTTSGDHRASKNQVRDLRRALRTLGAR